MKHNYLAAASILLASSLFITGCSSKTSHTFEVLTESTSTTETTETTTEDRSDYISGEDALESPGAVDIHKKIDTSNLTDDQIANIFYYNSCFIGDSLMAGFGYFAAYPESPEFMNNINYLAATNFSTIHALSPIDDKDAIHPIFRGEKITIFDGVSMLHPKRVFIELGMNEILGQGAIGRTLNNLSNIISKIRELSPGCEVYIISATPMTKDYETPTYNNELVRTYNAELQKSTDEWGAHYIDLASKLTGPDGCLPYSYSSDGCVHMTNETYLIWANYFKDYAVKYINGYEESTEATTEEASTEATTQAAAQETASQTTTKLTANNYK